MAHSKTVSDVVNDTLSTPAKPAAIKTASTASYTSFEPQAMKALLESAGEKAADKIARRKRGGRELAEFARIISAALAAELPMPSAIKAALKMAMAVGNGEDSLSWICQRLMGDFFWTFRRMHSLRSRAERQAESLAGDSDMSVNEVLAKLAESGDVDLNVVNDEHGEEIAEVTLDEVEGALQAMRQHLNDIYIQTGDAQYDELPLITQGSQMAYSVESAMIVAQSVIDRGNADRRAADKSILS